MREFNYDNLPGHCRGGMRDYVECGIIPGSFLQAVICNDLVLAFGKADDINTIYMKSYAEFLYNAPMGCWGSEPKMLKWHEAGGLRGVMNE